MFGLISTKDLYVLELRTIEKYEYPSIDERITYYSSDKYYVLAKKISSFDYKDVFTKSTYETSYLSFKVGSVVVRKSIPLQTTKSFITLSEAKKILEHCNNNEKKLTRKS